MLPGKAAAIRLQLNAESYGVDFNDHYLRKNANGTVTATVFGTEDELAALQDAGYELGATIEGPDTWRARIAERQADVKAEKRGGCGGTRGCRAQSHEDELVVLRVDYFENYDGRFLSVEAKTRLATVAESGSIYTGPTLSLSFNSGPGTPIDSTPRDDERQHRSRHDARHLHRAPRARADRRPGQSYPGRADHGPDRLEHRRVG